MAWFRREKQPIQLAEGSRVRTEGLWIKCNGCRQIIWKKDLESAWNVCPRCGFHFRLNAKARLRLLFDDGNYTTQDAGLETTDPLNFVDLKRYQDRVQSSQQSTGLKDALISAEGRMGGKPRDCLRHGIFLHWREHGLRGGGDADARHRTRRGWPAAAGDCVGIRRRTDDGRNGELDTDGQNQRRAGTAR